MNNKVRILWSGITGRTGKEALEIAKQNDQVEIVAGICRNNSDFYNYDQLDEIKEEFDVIVDFSHKDSFYKMLNFALKVKKPIIIGTSGLDEEQVKAYKEASKIIPVFRGGNFRYKVKEFIDSVVEYAKQTKDSEIELVETHYKTKKIPSETAKVVAKRVLDETGKIVNIKSFLEYDELINDYRVGKLHCRVIGFKELAEDVLKIAIIMKDKEPDGIYDLDRLLNK
jgi:dihydrodipicolinate reductase